MTRRPVVAAAPARELRRCREALGWTQVEAAAYLGYSPNHYAGFEQAREEVPTVVLRALYSQVLLTSKGSSNA